MLLNLAENTIDPKNVVQNIVEENKWEIQFFLVKNTKTGFGIFSE
jgi:hypothetical protein